MACRFQNIFAVSLLLTSILCGCGSSTAIASDPAHDVKILAASSQDGCYTELSVCIGGDLFPVSGQNIETPAFAPEICFSESAQKLFIILTENEGSGTYLSAPHIFDLSQDKPTELPYEDAVAFLDENLTGAVRKDGIITLTLPEQELCFDVSSLENPEMFFDALSYEGNVKYFIANDTLFCDLAIQFSPMGFLGTVRLEYELTEDGYRVKKTTFEASEDVAEFEVFPSAS